MQGLKGKYLLLDPRVKGEKQERKKYQGGDEEESKFLRWCREMI